MARTAKSGPAKRSLARQAVTETTPASSARFGVILGIGNTTVSLSSGGIAEAKTKGVEFTIRDPVTLGSLDDITIAGFNLKTDAIDKLPSLLQPVIDRITSLVWTVEYAHLKVPPETEKSSGIQYKIEVDGQFPNPVSLLGILTIKGVVFGASNEPEPPPTQTPPTQT